MAYAFLKVDDMPYPGDIVWCRWPGTVFHSGHKEYVRPVLVLDSWIAVEDNGSEQGALRVCYGTDIDSFTKSSADLIFNSTSENRACGLKKHTRFVGKDPYVLQLLWSQEFFMPNSVILNRSIILGSVSSARLDQIMNLLKDRGEYKGSIV